MRFDKIFYITRTTFQSLICFALGGFLLWGAKVNPFKYYPYLKEIAVVDGYIYSITEDYEEVEDYKGRGGIRYFYYYYYYFTLANDEVYWGGGEQNGKIPDSIKDSNISPSMVSIEYIPDSPSINRLKVNDSKDKTDKEKFLLDLVFSVIVFLVCGLAAFNMIIQERAEYKKILDRS